MTQPVLSTDTMFKLTRIQEDSFKSFHLFHTRQTPSGVAYGGLIFAQAVAAAENTVETQFKPHSMHSYFLSAVLAAEPITYNVNKLKEGRSFVQRSVEGVQNGKLCFMLQVSFHKPETESLIHQDLMPQVPRPEGLKDMKEAVIEMKRLVNERLITLSPAMFHRLMVLDNKAYINQEDVFEMRCANLGNYYGFASDLRPEMCFWMKTKQRLGDDERLHRWLIACMSDSILIVSAMTPHFSQGFEDTLHVSLDHSLYFHRTDFRADEWLLCESRSTISAGARCFIQGRIWTRDGVLVASCGQEAIVRGKDGQSSKI
ncbi:unnamed protein product [Caenorhabditis sp. 36 PRJEB53466]|nr:unnamed protein product [Caenorhabditis sp. 36 PRJEB53466]